MKLRPDLEGIVDALAHLTGASFARYWKAEATKMHRINFMEFDGFEPISHIHEDEYVLLSNGTDDCPVWPLDVSAATFGNDNDGDYWSFHRISTLNPKDMRGKLRIITPRMYKICRGRYETNGKCYTALSACASVNGRVVDALNRNLPFREQVDHSDDRLLIALAFGLALRKHYNWSVLLGENEGPNARFITDPVGVREAFRLRDIPPGKRRRAALRHWVRSHWRQTRDASANDKAWINEYLRGMTEFHWNGLRCKIEPSTVDFQRAMQSKMKVS